MTDAAEPKTLGLLPTERLDEFLDALGGWGQVFVPTSQKDGSTEFRLRGTGEMDLEQVNTRISAKNWAFPQSHPVFCYHCPLGDAPSLSDAPQVAKNVLFGLRPCDGRAFRILDSLFIEDTDFDSVNKDAQYAELREKLLLVGLGCATCEPTCFCSAFDISPTNASDTDLFLTPLEGGYLVEAATKRAEGLFDTIESLLDKAPEDGVDRRKELGSTVAAMQTKLPDPAAAEKGLDKEGAFEHEFFERLSETCLGCMACTYLCPTSLPPPRWLHVQRVHLARKWTQS